MHAKLLTDPIGPTLARLAAPNIVAMIVTLTTSMAEAFYVGQLGTASLAGLALAFPMMMLTMMMSGGSIGGATAGAIAQRLGANDRTGAEAIALHAVLLSVIMSIVFALLFLGFGKAIYSGLGGSGDVLTEALAYSDMFFAGCIGIWVSSGLNGVIRATGEMKVAASATIGGSIIQIIMSGIFVFGIGPMPALGIAGAAAGALCGFSFGALYQLWYLVRRSKFLTLHFSGVPIRFNVMKDILKTSGLASVSPISSVATVVCITAMMSRLGVDALAGYGIGARLEFLMLPLIFGIGSASITMVGAHFGAGAYARGLTVGWVAAFSAAALSGSIGIFMALFPSTWADLFSDAEAVRAACRSYLQIVGPFYAFFGLGLCLFFASQGARRMVWPVVGAIMRLCVILAGSFYLINQPDPEAADFFMVISASVATYGIVTALSIYLGAWTRGLPAK